VREFEKTAPLVYLNKYKERTKRTNTPLKEEICPGYELETQQRLTLWFSGH
jgi:hypothetical protein